jgi:hypothetical protein
MESWACICTCQNILRSERVSAFLASIYQLYLHIFPRVEGLALYVHAPARTKISGIVCVCWLVSRAERVSARVFTYWELWGNLHESARIKCWAFVCIHLHVWRTDCVSIFDGLPKLACVEGLTCTSMCVCTYGELSSCFDMVAWVEGWTCISVHVSASTECLACMCVCWRESRAERVSACVATLWELSVYLYFLAYVWASICKICASQGRSVYLHTSRACICIWLLV